MFDWQTIMALGALALSAFVVFSRAIDKGVTIREHTEFKDAIETQGNIRDLAINEAKRHIEERLIIREFNDWRLQISRDFDRVEESLRVIDATKPSTGELQVGMKAVEIRIATLEKLIQDIKDGNGKKSS